MKTLPVVSVKATFLDWPSNDDIAIIVYIAGCKHNCKNCQSPDLQNPEGFPHSDSDYTAEYIEKKCKENHTDKIVFSGGDPLYNNEALQEIIDILKPKGFKFCIYTGFEIEDVKNLIHGYDFVKTGMYDETLKQESMKTDDKFVLASTNQKFYNGNGKLLSKNGVLKFK